MQVASAAHRSAGLDYPELSQAHPDIAAAIKAQQPALIKMARRFAQGYGIEHQDFLQTALVEVIEASRTYDVAWGPFDRFVLMIARRSMRNQQRYWKVRRPERIGIPIDDLLEAHTDRPVRDEDRRAVQHGSDETEPLTHMDLQTVTEVMHRILTRKERDAYYMVMVEDQAKKDVALILEVSRPRVTQLVQSAHRKLRGHFGI